MLLLYWWEVIMKNVVQQLHGEFSLESGLEQTVNRTAFKLFKS